MKIIDETLQRHNPYFNRWFSAIVNFTVEKETPAISHNPYFNRWFSAMDLSFIIENKHNKSQSLF